MNRSFARYLAASLAVAASSALCVPLANAQGDATASGATAAQATPSSSSKAQRKAARKQARAKNKAELKKLEDAGYNPSQSNDANYPQDIQNAEKKAGVGAGASQ